MPSTRSLRPYARGLTAVALAAGASLTVVDLAGGAIASPAPKGDNGDVKIHRVGTPVDDPRNEPKVCGFYLDGFNFDPGQHISWVILSWPPTGNKTKALDGDLTMSPDGNGHTGDLSLPNGHYKLFWHIDEQTPAKGGDHKRAKHKVFWVKCDTSTPGPDETETPDPGKTDTPNPGKTDTPNPGDTEAPVPNPVDTDLPVTG